MKQLKRITKLLRKQITEKDIQAENTKQHHQRRKNLDETIKTNIQAENKKQHQQRRKNFDETTTSNIHSENAKQHQKRGKNTKMEREKAFDEVQGMSSIAY